jgi:hypothetical protein
MSRLSTRISIKWASDAPSEPTDTLVMSIGDYYMDLRVRKVDISIDWAMAGQRLIKSEDPLTVEFTHEIDSRGYTEPDLGVFTKLPNGDDLEVGEMPCPEKGGAVTAYEEIWHEFPAPAEGTVSWIVRNDDPETGITFLGRLENAYLAFRKTLEGKFTALREAWDPKTGKWEVKYRIGDDEVPTMKDVVKSDLGSIVSKTSIDVSGASYRVIATAVEGKD